ncbi:microtubule associated protein [Paramyrothecium foliicola]|nr:microtubule associated protein [Paramyrothecium foliicola]
MDFIKNAVSGGSKSNEQKPQGGEQKQDYGDKAFDTISKKAGYDFNPQTDEKITDAARGAYEKFSGPLERKPSIKHVKMPSQGETNGWSERYALDGRYQRQGCAARDMADPETIESRPSTARRVSPSPSPSQPADPPADAPPGAPPSPAHDATDIGSRTQTPQPPKNSKSPAPTSTTGPAPDLAAAAAADVPPGDSSFAVMDHTHDFHDDSTAEAAVLREHFKDVESSFLPALSPIPTGRASADGGGVDDTYLFDSPNKAAMQPPPPPPQRQQQLEHQQPPDLDEDQDQDQDHDPLGHESTAVSGDTSTAGLENFDSSPTAAAAARTISRAVSAAGAGTASPTPSSRSKNTVNGHSLLSVEDTATNTQSQNTSRAQGLSRDDSFISNSSVNTDGEHSTSLSRSQSLSERAGSTPGHALRAKRPKYLRSRYGSQRSSTSSFVTNPDSYDGSDNTVGLGADYALQTGGAVPAMGMTRSTSNPMYRTVSTGSMVSALGDDYPETPGQPLEPLAEVDSPERRRNSDDAFLKTPKPSRENLNVPTDTVIARHVRNVQVPESLAKEYKFKSGLETPRMPSATFTSGTSTVGRTGGRSMTLKEQSSTIERLSKENFDLKLKVMFLSDRLDKLSEEGIKEMISENVDLKTSIAVLQRDNKMLRRRVKELEKRVKDDNDRPSTARSGASSTDQTARMDDEETREREEELLYLRERVEEYAVEIERLRNESLNKEAERRKMAEMVRSFGDRASDNFGRQEEADVWKDLLEQETARREQADEDNRKLREEVFRLKQEASGTGGLHHTTNIYNITKKQKERTGSPTRPVSGHSGDIEGSNANFSAASTLVEELRRETEQLRHENAELRREVGAQTSMLTSRNREKERLYQEIEDLKIAQRRGAPAPSTIDSLLDRSASRLGHAHIRSQSRGSARTRQTTEEEELEREEIENKLSDVRDKLSEAKLRNQELQRELDTCMEDFEAAVTGKREVEESALTLQEDLDNAMNDLVALQAERDEALREQSDMENEFEALRKEAQEEIDALEAEADVRGEEIQRLQIDLQERTENFEALQEEMRSMSEALVRLEDEQDNKLRRIQQLEEELDSSNKELEELEQKLLDSNDKNQRLLVQQESAQGEIAFLREEQEADKIRIGDLEAAIANAEQSLREEKDHVRELENLIQQERMQREVMADKEKEEVQQFVDELNREKSAAKDEVRRLRKNLSSREVEATEWKERLMELESNLREALGDLNGTRSSLLKSIAKMQRELENTIRELDTTKASLVEKDRIIKQRDALLESSALESRKLTEILEKERVAHRNTKSQFETFQKTHQHLTRTASTQDIRIAELESTRSQDKRRITVLEQTMRDQLLERNELLLQLWQKLSMICGREWSNSNTLIDRQVLPSLEVVATRLPGFSKNLLAAVKAIEAMIGSFQTKIKSVERDLQREYQTLENNLEVRTKKLDRLEAMVRNAVASGSLGSQDLAPRLLRLEDAYRQLKVENATLRTASDVRARAAYAASSNSDGHITGSPSPSVPRGPGDRDKDRGTRSSHGRSTTMTRANTTPGLPTMSGLEVALTEDSGGGSSSGGGGSADKDDKRWLLRLRDMEYKLKMEREGRNQDRQAARQRLGGLESENKDLRDRVKRVMGEGDYAPLLISESDNRLRVSKAARSAPVFRRSVAMAAAQKQPKKEGDISDAFASMAGVEATPLPDSFRQLKLDLIRGREGAVRNSWRSLLRELRRENDIIAAKGPAIVPEVEFKDLERALEDKKSDIKLRGAVVVKGVIPEAEARAYKDEIEEYVRNNPWTRAFPPHDPQVFELYWSPSQIKARSHPSLLKTQQLLMTSLWHTSSPEARISMTNPFSYADRLRIRRPGDAAFALGPHMDGGSVERWEPEGYGRGGVYDKVFEGDWHSYDPWDASGRVDAVNNRYDGLGPCSMFRMWQGWLGLSHTSPGEGTLLVNPLMSLATAYTLLRPFFRPLASKSESKDAAAYLDEANWKLMGPEDMTSDLQGAVPGRGQEYTDEWHPHLELEKSMVNVPRIQPGDYVAWHCDTIHAVDKVHAGTGDSSVMYIPVCPVTELNAEYLVRQREAFLNGTPGPDFPGGEGESRHVGRPGLADVKGDQARQAMGLERVTLKAGQRPTEADVVRRVNEILGF